METLWGIELLLIVRVLVSAFLAVLFLQSGLDKVLDWRGNLAYITEHFAQSPLRAFPWPMLAVVTVLEVVAGLAAAIGVAGLVFYGEPGWAFVGAALAALNLLLLFLGQRIAKEYGGAEILVNYFVLTVIAMLVEGGFPIPR